MHGLVRAHAAFDVDVGLMAVLATVLRLFKHPTVQPGDITITAVFPSHAPPSDIPHTIATIVLLEKIWVWRELKKKKNERVREKVRSFLPRC